MRVLTLWPSCSRPRAAMHRSCRARWWTYFPLFETELPGWLPFWGGDHFEFFSAIFNIADAAITVGTIWLIIDQMFFSPKNSKKEEENDSENPEKSEKAVA